MNDIKQQIMALVDSGQLAAAREQAQQACSDSPEDAELWYFLSAICGHMQDFGAAEEYIRRAISINPNVAAAHFNLAIALRHNGEPAAAMSSLERVVALEPGFAAAWLEMANISLVLQDADAALVHLEKVQQLQPGTWQAMTLSGTAHAMLGESQPAIQHFRSSLDINPAQADTFVKLARQLEVVADYEQAIRMYLKATQYGYDQADAKIAAALLYEKLGDRVAARREYNAVLQFKPDSVEALVNLALVDEHDGQFEHAMQRLEQAIHIAPDNSKARYNHARILAAMRRYSDAIRVYEDLLEDEPSFQQALMNLGNIYLLYGRVQRAAELYRKACDIEPYNHEACSNLLLAQNYRTDISAEGITSMHREWAQRISSQIDTVFEHPAYMDSQRPVRVGYISPDLRLQSVAFFFISVLEHASHAYTVNICYSDVTNPDEMTLRLQCLADEWYEVSRLDDVCLAHKVFDDDIDVLVDLAGHMAGNRQLVFAMKPAPVQMTWLGYPNTTGLESIDFRFIDVYTDPPGSQHLMVETPVRASSSFLCYTPPTQAPDVSSAPVEQASYVTFGSFNNLAKMNDEVIAAWVSIMQRVPNARLCVKARQYCDEELRRRDVQRYCEAGVDEARLDLISYARSIEEHLSLYGRIDIALDTFPYNGTTTTFEALWMGVPVVTLRGDRHASRVGYSILAHLGREELIADTVTGYVDIAVGLARDIVRVVDLRTRLRQELAGSVLTDAAAFTGKFERTLVSLARHAAP